MYFVLQDVWYRENKNRVCTKNEQSINNFRVRMEYGVNWTPIRSNQA